MFKNLLVVLLLGLSVAAVAKEVESETTDQSYKLVDFAEFVEFHKVSDEMARRKERLMLRPSPVQFSAKLMSVPKPGSFTLAYEALSLWQGGEDTPVWEQLDISHSAFIGLNKGPVLGMYLTRAAAEQFAKIKSDTEMQFYGLHLYNYTHGPRLLIFGGKPVK